MSSLTNTLNNGVFLLIIGISANFLGNTINCSAQKILTNNVIIKHLLILAIIQFTLDFSVEKNIKTGIIDIKYLDRFLYTFGIYILFILLTKQTYNTFIINIILLLLIYISHKLFKKNNKIKRIITYVEYLWILSLVIGTGLYLRKQYNEYKNDFSLYKFFLGTHKCTNITS